MAWGALTVFVPTVFDLSFSLFTVLFDRRLDLVSRSGLYWLGPGFSIGLLLSLNRGPFQFL